MGRKEIMSYIKILIISLKIEILKNWFYTNLFHRAPSNNEVEKSIQMLQYL